MSEGHRRARWEALVVAVGWLAGAAVFFRAQWTSGFSHLMGNNGDTRLNVYICENWYQFFHGKASWNSPAFFYPVKGVLGWSDAQALYEVFYAPLRQVGCDPFLALQLTVILLSLVGFSTFYWLARTILAAPMTIALVGSWVFTFSNSLFLHVSDAQLSTVYLVPPLALMVIGAWRSGVAGRRRRSAGLAASAGLYMALLFFTGYYMAWFSLLAAVLVLGLSIGASLWREGPGVVKDRLWLLNRLWVQLGAAVVGFGLGIIPFAITYLGVNFEESYANAYHYSVGPLNLVNVGAHNVLWSTFIRHLAPSIRYSTYEATYAITPLVMLVAGLGFLSVCLLLRSGRAIHAAESRLTVVLGACAFVMCVLPLHFHGVSPWAVAYHLPGGRAIRAVFRLQIVTGSVVALVLVGACSELSCHMQGRSVRLAGLRLAGVGLLMICALEQVNSSHVSSIDDRAQLSLLASVKRPPLSCRSFYVVDSSHVLASFEYQLDAMLISQRLSLPTLNGYSGHSPPGWGMGNPATSGYLTAVEGWVTQEHRWTGLCRLDLATMNWAAAGTG